MSISIISPTGRALQVKLEQAAQQGANPEQVMQMLNQNVGMVSFPELMAMKSQYDAIKNSKPPAAPPKDTVVNDMSREINARGSGVPSLPVNNVGNPGSYAGGGIVSFQSGGPAFTPSMLATPSEAAYTMNYAEQLKSMGATAEEIAAVKIAPTAEAKAGAISKIKSRLGKLNPNVTWKGAGSMAARAAPYYGAAALGTGVVEAVRTLSGDAVPIEPIRGYYADLQKKLSGIVPEKKGMEIDPRGSSFWGDAGLRALAMGQHMGTVGMTGPIDAYRGSQKTDAAAKPSEDNFDATEYLDDTGISGGITSGMYEQMKDIKLAREKLPEAPNRPTIQDEIRREDTAAGVGRAHENRLMELGKEKTELKAEKKRDSWLAAAEGFFKMAEAASKPGASFLGSAAEGATTGLTSYKQLLKDVKQSEREMRSAVYAAEQAKESLALNQSSRAEARYASAMQTLEHARNRNAEFESREAIINGQIAMNNRDNRTKEKVYSATGKHGEQVLANVGRISKEGHDRGLSQTQIDARIDKYLAMVTQVTQATSGTYLSTVEKGRQQANMLNMGGAGDDAGFNATRVEDREDRE